MANFTGFISEETNQAARMGGTSFLTAKSLRELLEVGKPARSIPGAAGTHRQ